MVLSSRDRRLIDVYMVWLGPSLERRRLRFSFQFNDVKDPDRLSPAPLFSAGGRRRRLSSGRPLSCQPILSDFILNLGKSDIRSKNRSRASEELPSSVQRFDWSAELMDQWWKDQGPLVPEFLRQSLGPEARGVFRGRSLPCQSRNEDYRKRRNGPISNWPVSDHPAAAPQPAAI